MRIGELSRRSGISVRMLRYYESKGLLKPHRQASGYRSFDEADLALVEAIRTLNSAGLKLDVVRRILPCVSRAGFEPCVELRKSLRVQIDRIDLQIAALSKSRNLLGQHLRRLK